ncbi:hypothetical protein HMPREF1631_04365 [Arcanobacterium sp. S3PF19]|nr:hypothetical protein HMPREF1631_04365 [Arcanobacterium sp. S3PF19]
MIARNGRILRCGDFWIAEIFTPGKDLRLPAGAWETGGSRVEGTPGRGTGGEQYFRKCFRLIADKVTSGRG